MDTTFIALDSLLAAAELPVGDVYNTFLIDQHD